MSWSQSSGPEKTGFYSQYHALLYKVFMCFRSTVVPGWTINLILTYAFKISSKCIKTISTYHNVYSNYISILWEQPCVFSCQLAIVCWLKCGLGIMQFGVISMISYTLIFEITLYWRGKKLLSIEKMHFLLAFQLNRWDWIWRSDLPK